MRTLVYDVEVQNPPEKIEGGWDNPEAMKLSSCVIYDSQVDRYMFHLINVEEAGTVIESDKMRDLRLCLSQADLLVSFNGIRFDDRVIWGNERKDIPRIPHYDILLEYVRSCFHLPSVEAAEKKLGDKTIHDGSFSLDGLAEGTLGLCKSGHGAKAPDLWSAGRYDELLAYNLNDVRLTWKLFGFIRSYGFVRDRSGLTVVMPRFRCLPGAGSNLSTTAQSGRKDPGDGGSLGGYLRLCDDILRSS